MNVKRAGLIAGFAALLVGLLVLMATQYRARQAVPALPTQAEVPDNQKAGLELRWFGTSTLTLTDHTTTILVDGFFSRPGKLRLALASTGLPLVKPDEDGLGDGLKLLAGQEADAILVAHAHHDHALDTARVARAQEKQATVYGSDSVRHVVCGQDPDGGIPFGVVSDGSVVKRGAFKVTVLASSHEPTFFGPEGDISCPLQMPARLRAFKSGPSFAFFIEHPLGNVLGVPSAVMDCGGPALKGVRADVVLLGVGMLGNKDKDAMRAYWTSVVCPTQTGRVHLIHWDDFTLRLNEPLKAFPFDRLAHTVSVLKPIARRDGIALSYLPLSTAVAVTPSHRPQSSFCPDDTHRPDPRGVPLLEEPEIHQCGRFVAP